MRITSLSSTLKRRRLRPFRSAFDPEDLSVKNRVFLSERRGEANKFGIALHLDLFRFLGTYGVEGHYSFSIADSIMNKQLRPLNQPLRLMDFT